MPDEAVLEQTETENTLEQTTTVEETPAVAEVPAEETNAGGGEVAPVENSGIDQELAQLAQAYGVEYSDPSSLAKHLAVTFDRELSRLGSQKPEPAATAAGDKAPATPSGLDLEKLVGELLPEAEVDPTLRKGVQSLLAKVADHFGQQHNAFKDEFGKTFAQRFEAIEQFQQRLDDERTTAQIDAFFEAQGPEWAGEFGKGSIRDLRPQSPQFQARNAVVKEAIALKAGYERIGQTPPPTDQLLKRARAALYADKQTTIAKQQVAQQLNTRKNAALSRPASKSGKPLSSEAQTIAKLEEWVSKAGS